MINSLRVPKAKKTTVEFSPADQLAINALRFMSMDMIEQANSGHPGSPLGMAPMAYTLWEKFMNFNPVDDKWINRDRFVLSGGHCSSLLYSLLHFNGFDLTLEDINNFRQLGSRTPGHPEYQVTAGVDCSTGPLGQGFGMAVGMAMAERHLAAMYNRPEYPIINHHTYCIVGDGDLMEGVAEEAMNLAGKNQLGRLIVLYDSNDVTLDGPLDLSTNENVKKRFKAAGWDYQRVDDGNDLESISRAIKQAEQTTKPSLIEIKTTIGFKAPNAGTSKVHGSPLGEEGLKATRENYGWDYEPFEYPTEVYQRFNHYLDEKKHFYQEWQEMFSDYQLNYPTEAAALMHQQFDASGLTPHHQVGETVSTRVANAEVLQDLGERNPQLWGGAADLFASNKTDLKQGEIFSSANYRGRNVYFGVREFGMAAAINGINLHGASQAFCSTFMAFSDYVKPAIRLAALQNLPSIFIFTHDSVAVGEDGPTHEPVEQLAMLRTIPNVQVFRPADVHETIAAWKVIAKTTDKPSIIIASRQNLPVLAETMNADAQRGAYIAAKENNRLDGILLASGSELSLALEAKKVLAAEHNLDVRVISMVSMEQFNRQPAEYRKQLLPADVRKRLAVEMATPQMWSQYVGLDGKVIGIDQFGMSGNGAEVVKKYGFTVDNVVKQFIGLNE